MEKKQEGLRIHLLNNQLLTPIRKVTRFNCDFNFPTDDVAKPDSDSDLVAMGHRYRIDDEPLAPGNPLGDVRVEIAAGISPADAVRAIKKVLRWIENNPEDLLQKWGYEDDGGYVIEPERGERGRYGNGGELGELERRLAKEALEQANFEAEWQKIAGTEADRLRARKIN